MWNLPEPQDDGLLIADVSDHSHNKHYFLMRYLDAFTVAMRKKWAGLHYIDLFAGPGIEKLKHSGELEWGSPLIAAHMPRPFTQLHLCEKSPKKCEALRIRVDEIQRGTQVLCGSANRKIGEIVREIPGGTLSVAFLDPYGLHLDFETLETLSEIRADLIIFFPDHLDALRNWERYYLRNPNSNLDRCLGKGSDWRSKLNSVPPQHRVQLLLKLYIGVIRSLGYSEFDSERISTACRQPLYRLIYCSRHKAGVKIWRGISGKKPDGQKTFDFD